MKYLRKFTSQENANQGGTEGLTSPHVDIVLIGNRKVPNYVKLTPRRGFNCEFDNMGKIIQVRPTFSLLTSDNKSFITSDGKIYNVK